jgi:hypothetical protein
MLGSTRSTITFGLLATILALGIGGCQERNATRESVATVSPGALADVCAADFLRPAAAAPAEGLWLYERPPSAERVAAMIGPARPDDGRLVVTRPVETVEVSAAGDTIRHRTDTAHVALELLPTLRQERRGGDGTADSIMSSQPAATYSPSAGVRLAAYEPCAASIRGPRIRYLRRDTTGRIITDVMLQRASER